MVKVIYPPDKPEGPKALFNKKVLDAAAVKASIMEWPGLYQTEDGTLFKGMPVSQVPSQLITSGWRNVSHLRESDFEKMGLEIETARYVGGVHPKRFCRVVVAKDMKQRLPKFDRLVNKVAKMIDADTSGHEIENLVLEMGEPHDVARKVARELGRMST